MTDDVDVLDELGLASAALDGVSLAKLTPLEQDRIRQAHGSVLTVMGNVDSRRTHSR